MQLIRMLVSLLFMVVGSIGLIACETTDSNMPISKFPANIHEGVVEGAITEDQSIPREEIPSSPLQAEVTRAIPMEFTDLDFDSNGAIDQNEAKNVPELRRQWWNLDQNTDGQLNTAEFSRFEQEVIAKAARP